MPDEVVASRPAVPAAEFARAVRERFVPDPALVERGRVEVIAGTVGIGIGLAMPILGSPMPAVSIVSALVGTGLLVGGVLGSSRIARAVVTGAGALATLVLAGLASGFGRFAPGMGPWEIATTIGAIAMIATGSWLAVLRRPARAWHEERLLARAHRRERKAAALDRWRREALPARAEDDDAHR